MPNTVKHKDLVDRRIEEISKEYNGDFKEFARVLVNRAGRPEQCKFKLQRLTYLINGSNFGTLAQKYKVDDSDSKFYLDIDFQSEVTPEMCPKQVPDQLEEFLLKTADFKEWPTRGNPIHWYIDVKDEDWFNEWAHLHQNEDRSKGDFTEIHFVPGFLIKIAGWRGDVMFTLPLYPEKEKPVYTLKEGIKKISEFIIAGKIKIPGFEYN